MRFFSFAGTRGAAKTLIGLFGAEAVYEFRRERIWHAEDDSAQERAGLTLLLPAANLRHRIVPRSTRVLFEGRVWSVESARAHYDGARVHAWELVLTEI